jgi:antitoxin component YwqK of YwqJK toxin-antitoxin module
MKKVFLFLIIVFSIKFLNAQERKEYYDNGNLKNIGQREVTNGNPIGEWKYYYESGKLSAIGKYENGKATGKWKEYYKTGQLQTVKTYKNGVLNGQIENYSENGFLDVVGMYVNGKPHGELRAYLENVPESFGHMFENGERTGIRKTYYETGKLKEVGMVVNDTKIGEWKYYYESGELSGIGKFENGKLTGERKEYYRNGNLKSSITFVDGNQLGLYEIFLFDGSPSEKGNNGKKGSELSPYYGPIGNWTSWEYYSNGQLKRKHTNDQSGDYTGIYESYYENGELERKGKYMDDEKEGIWYEYFIDTQKKYKIFYENGEGILSKSREVNSINDPIEDQFYKLKFKNKCTVKILVAVSFKNLDGEWETKGFYDIEPNEEVYLAKTENRIYYYHAHSMNGIHIWEGEHVLNVRGGGYNFKERTIPSNKAYGDHYTNLGCDE